MARQYRLSPEGREKIAANAAKARAAANSLDSHIRRIERRQDELTPEHLARLADLVLRDEPNREAPLPPKTAAEIARLLGGGSQ
ncbi:hypothetical protein N7U49_35440 [Streptomyces sp. AD2-2]|nr:hypothetical protein N7U49_35440 [Streptomyces sp. AD2-2]